MLRVVEYVIGRRGRAMVVFTACTRRESRAQAPPPFKFLESASSLHTQITHTFPDCMSRTQGIDTMEDQENVAVPAGTHTNDTTRDTHGVLHDAPHDSTHKASRKPKKPPPVTPKRFSRFFTPRSSISRASKASTSKAGRQLRDITQSEVNTRSSQASRRSRSPKKMVLFKDIQDLSNAATATTTAATPTLSSKKRKAYMSPESQRFDSSPCKRVSEDDGKMPEIPSSPPVYFLEDAMTRDRSTTPEIKVQPLRIRRAGIGNVSGRMLHRSFGGLDITGRGRRKDNCTYWQADTGNFHARPEDRHRFAHPALPYCSVSCNTNSLVAMGDETGAVRLVETARDDKHGFGSTHISMQAHTNALLDLAFSSDDSMLATASGDQTSRVIDMHTQKIKYCLQGHTTSLKQVRFQPGNDNVLATSSRDGSINIWDLRCKGAQTTVDEIYRPRNFTPANLLSAQSKAYAASPYKTIWQAHASLPGTATDVPSASGDSGAKDLSHPHQARIGNVSVTALSFLNSPGSSHMLLSGSELSTTLHLWDIRNRYSRRGGAQPLSSTAEPQSHAWHRHFGITALVQDAAGRRVYALSRDNTVYAYSAAHLINGHAPQLEADFSERHSRSSADQKTGLGPIYGFRHPLLHVTNFYTKAAIRQAKDDKSEMLAVASADRCAILFPTDESTFPKPQLTRSSGLNTPILNSSAGFSSPLASTSRPAISRQTSFATGLNTRMRDSIPIHNIGTALVGGHSKEVTDLTFTHDGDLVTVGDDFSGRLWREDKEAAREARGTKGAGSGWAEVQDGMDHEDWEE